MANKKNNNLSTELSITTLEKLGLSKQPFASEILSEKSFFNHQALDKITENLLHQIQFSDLLLIVEGAHGSGKTSLFRQIIQTEITNTKSLSVQAEATDTLVQVQQKISLHLQELGDANHLDDNLKSLQMFDQTPLLIMDNSHVLSDTTLQELFRYKQSLKQEHEVTLKILLFANSGMAETLQKITELSADQMYVQNMPDFSPKQADNFILHKLHNADYSGEPLFDEQQLQLLFRKCNGTPLNILQLATPLIEKTVNKKPAISISGWLKPAIASSAIIFLAGSGYAAYVMFFDKQNDADVTEVIEPQRLIESTTELYTEASIAETDTTAPLNDIDNLNNDVDVIDILEQEQTPETITEVAPEPEALTEELALSSTLSQPVVVEPAPVSTPKTEAPAIKPVEIPAKPEPAPAKVIKKTAPVALNRVVNKPSIQAEPALHPTLMQLDALGVENAEWIKQQASNAWTMQLLGARDPETLLKFVRRNQLTSPAAWYKTWLKGKPYYVLVYGSYASRDLARASIDGLPANLRSLKPWVKSVKSVQLAIK